jgi:hypothetical protein
MEKHFSALRKKYPKAPKIHQILDRGPYNISKDTKNAAEKYGIILHQSNIWPVFQEKQLRFPLLNQRLGY